MSAKSSSIATERFLWYSFSSFNQGRDLSDRRAAILTAAGPLFEKHGLRAATMEAIARAAGVAKPTLYAYFPDKDAVFRAVAEHVRAERRGSRAAALRAQGGAVQRVGAALVAELRERLQLRMRSPHASELY